MTPEEYWPEMGGSPTFDELFAPEETEAGDMKSKHTYFWRENQFFIRCKRTRRIFRPSKEGWACGCEG